MAKNADMNDSNAIAAFVKSHHSDTIIAVMAI